MTTTSRTGRPHRGGFTLIELLVVIAIMAVLAAVAVGTFFRIQGNQVAKGTEDRIKNLNAGLNRQWTATLDTGRKEFKDNTGNCATTLTTYCGGDRDRALSLYLYLKIKNEFPQTFDEAANPTQLPATGTAVLTLPKKNTFAKLPNTPPANATEAAHQSAAILRIILTERAARGEMYGEESLGAGGGSVTIGTASYPVFNDLWGQPLAYVRFATNAEINAGPFTKPGTTSPDPLDPAGKLNSWSGTNRDDAARAVFGQRRTTFPNQNWMLTVLSSGPDQDDPASPPDAQYAGKYMYNSVFRTTAAAFGLGAVSTAVTAANRDSFIEVDTVTDDILGYRLRREGQGGN